jgi:hypothetical protein
MYPKHVHPAVHGTQMLLLTNWPAGQVTTVGAGGEPPPPPPPPPPWQLGWALPPAQVQPAVQGRQATIIAFQKVPGAQLLGLTQA